VLKKWFDRPRRLTAFALWVAARATSRKGKAGGAASGLFREARALLAGLDKFRPALDRKAAESLYDRLREFQHEHQRQKWVSVRIVHTTNVDPAVAEGTPAATSRYYSIATQQIIQANLNLNNRNVTAVPFGVDPPSPVETMDPSRPQDGSMDPSIEYGAVPGVPYCASYNAELFKQLSPTMISVLQAQFPPNP